MAWARLTRCTGTVAALVATLALALPTRAAGLSVRLGPRSGGVRVVIDSPAKLEATDTPSGGARLTFYLTGLPLGEALEGHGRSLVTGWRLVGAEDGEARLTLDLLAPAQVRDRFVIPPSMDHPGWRYVIDLARSDAVLSATAADHPMDPVSHAISKVAPSAALGAKRIRTARAAATPERKVIVIDAGHGGKDPGAQSDGANEKDITLAAARYLRRRLMSEGHYKVVMTRTSDVFVSLEARVRIARRASADLFIALHADSAGDRDATHGASVYTLSGHGETRVKEVMGAHEWFARAAPRNDPAVKGILLDLTQRTTLNRSNEFAQLLVDRLSEKIDVLPRTHRDAGYFVLLAPDVPAVLLEMGFISSPVDEARLTDRARRDALMDTVAAAIGDYFRGAVQLAAD